MVDYIPEIHQTTLPNGMQLLGWNSPGLPG